MAAPGMGESTRARSRGSSAIAAGTFLVTDAKVPEASMISTRILKPAAPSDGRNNCVAMTRRLATAWTESLTILQRLPAIAYDA